jgi:hypothetical protein
MSRSLSASNLSPVGCVALGALEYEATVMFVGPVRVDALSVVQFTLIRHKRRLVLVPSERRYAGVPAGTADARAFAASRLA